MKNKHSYLPKNLVTALFVALTLTASVSNAATLLQWNTAGNLGTETSELSVFNATGLGNSTLTLGSVTAAANGNRFGGSGWFNTGNTVAGNTLAEAIAGNDYIQFVVTPDALFGFDVTEFVFTWDRSSTGPSSVALRSSADNFAADLGSVTGMISGGATTDRTIAISGLTGLTSATTFRLYGFGATATGGTGGFDTTTGDTVPNVQLNGEVYAIPEPSRAILLGLGSIGLIFRRRRQ